MLRRLALILILVLLTATCNAEYVTVDLLNGRAKPSRRSAVTALFDYGDELTVTGRWSADHNWIEVVGGEDGNAWVHIKYVSVTVEPYLVENMDYCSIKIRRHPVDGRLSGYLKKGEQIEIDRDVLGWGHCSKGWIDLSLVAEVCGDDCSY